MVQQSQRGIEKYLVYITVGISMLVGSFGAFFMYINKNIKSKSELRSQINELLSEMYISEDKHMVAMVIICCMYMTLLWILGFIIYKIVFKIAGVKVKDTELLIALGSGYILSFLTGYYLTGRVNDILLTLIVNTIEMSVVYIGLFDKIKEKIGICILIRGIVLVLNVALAMQ